MHHPFYILTYHQIFRVGTTIISDDLQYKYCDDVNDGVCQDYRQYCSDGKNGKFRKEYPAKDVKPLVRQYIRANIVSATFFLLRNSPTFMGCCPLVRLLT